MALKSFYNEQFGTFRCEHMHDASLQRSMDQLRRNSKILHTNIHELTRIASMQLDERDSLVATLDWEGLGF